jgi:uncharacterized protein (DUF2267 family)
MADPSVIQRTVLRTYLHALRDRLTVDEAAELAAQLPELIRGIYYEGWDPSKTPVRYEDLADFLDRVSAGEIEDIRAQPPENLQPILG